MSHAPTCRLAAAFALLAGLGVAACGGGDPVDASTSAKPGATSTLLDDSGLPMPSDPTAVPAGKATLAVPRHATAAQAEDLRRALGTGVRSVQVECCGDSLVDAAIAAAIDPAAGVPLAVLIEGNDTAAAMAAAERLQAAGLESVWVVAR